MRCSVEIEIERDKEIMRRNRSISVSTTRTTTTTTDSATANTDESDENTNDEDGRKKKRNPLRTNAVKFARRRRVSFSDASKVSTYYGDTNTTSFEAEFGRCNGRDCEDDRMIAVIDAPSKLKLETLEGLKFARKRMTEKLKGVEDNVALAEEKIQEGEYRAAAGILEREVIKTLAERINAQQFQMAMEKLRFLRHRRIAILEEQIALKENGIINGVCVEKESDDDDDYNDNTREVRKISSKTLPINAQLKQMQVKGRARGTNSPPSVINLEDDFSDDVDNSSREDSAEVGGGENQRGGTTIIVSKELKKSAPPARELKTPQELTIILNALVLCAKAYDCLKNTRAADQKRLEAEKIRTIIKRCDPSSDTVAAVSSPLQNFCPFEPTTMGSTLSSQAKFFGNSMKTLFSRGR